MKVLVLYRSHSDHGREVETYGAEFEHRCAGVKLELQDVDRREGAATASLYDITSYPAVLVLQDNGTASMVWQGQMLPLIDEVAGYALA